MLTMTASTIHGLLIGDGAFGLSTIDLVVLAAAGALGLGLYVAYILVPAWVSYSRTWERLAASVLTLYVLGVLVGVGIGAALIAVYYWG
jgi:hypothetical protein